MYRQTFPGITHRQYLDESTYEEAQWMTHIHNLYGEIRRRNEEREMARLTGGI